MSLRAVSAGLAGLLALLPPFSGQSTAAEEAMLVPCLGIAADSSPVFPTDVFPDPTSEVSACFRVGPDESLERLTAVFIAEDVGDAAPPNYAIVETSLDLQGQKQGRFRFENPRPMPAGTYRVEVSADGRPWRAARYAIVEPPDEETAGDLLPLGPGRRWTYRFEQRAGEGASLDLPDVQPDAQGVYHAMVTLEVAGEDDAGWHVLTSRNGQPVFEEWWRRAGEGWTVTRRKQGYEVMEIDPPQRLVGTADGERQWTYPPFGQTFAMWGPFPMEGQWGAGSGYVVVATQAQAPFTVTAERHFVPGTGMVREIIVQALAGRILSRQELELQSTD